MAWNWNEIQSVLKEETFKTWRERTNELIEQQNNFVSWQAAIDSRWYVTDTSSSTTTYTGVTSPGATGTDSLVAGYFIVFRPATNNTGASTLNIASSDGAVDIKKIASGAKVALAADDLDSDNYAELIFDGTDWLMMNAPIDALPTQSGNAGKFLTTDASTASWAEAGGGKVLQVVSATSTVSSNTTSTTYVASNLTASITPADAANKVLVLITSVARVSTTGTMYYTLYEDGVDIGGSVDNRGMGKIYHAASHMVDIPISLIHLASPASTSAVTYTLYYLADGSVTAECPPTNNMIQNIVLMEIAV